MQKFQFQFHLSKRVIVLLFLVLGVCLLSSNLLFLLVSGLSQVVPDPQLDLPSILPEGLAGFTPNPYTIFVLWTFASGTACLAHLYSANDARIDRNILQRHADLSSPLLESRLFAARGNIALSTSLAIVQFIDFLVGIFAWAERISTPPPPFVSPTLLTLLVTMGLLLQEFMLMGVSFAMVWFRHRLQRKVLEGLLLVDQRRKSLTSQE